MAYRYRFAEPCKDDLDELAKHEHRLMVRLVYTAIPRILHDPQTVGDRKTGNLRNCYGFTISASGAAYRLLYVIEADVVVFFALGRHDVVYKNAAKRIP